MGNAKNPQSKLPESPAETASAVDQVRAILGGAGSLLSQLVEYLAEGRNRDLFQQRWAIENFRVREPDPASIDFRTEVRKLAHSMRSCDLMEVANQVVAVHGGVAAKWADDTLAILDEAADETAQLVPANSPDPRRANELIRAFGAREKMLARLPQVPSTNAPQTADIISRLTEAQRAIWDVVNAAGHRMTQTQIAAALNERGLQTSDGMLKKDLSEMSLRMQILPNRSDTRPRGYGLAGWD